MLFLGIIRIIICTITLIVCINIVILSKKINKNVIAAGNSGISKQDLCVNEFVSNFNNVADNFYVPIDKKEMLNRAFNSVLTELNDKYTKTLSKREIDFSYNYNFYTGYKFELEKDGVVVTSITEPSILKYGLREHDKIISINGKILKRT